MKRREKRTPFASVRGAPMPLLVFGVMLSASLAFRCAGKSDSDGGTTKGGSPAQGGSGAAAGVGTGGVISQGGSAGSTSQPCTEANLATDCPLPPSICQDPSSMAYYSDVHCVSGQCSYTLQVYRCPGSCSSGACTASTMTAVGPPPPDPRCMEGTAGSAGSGGQSSGAIPPLGGAGGASGAGDRIIIGGAGFGAGGTGGASTTGGAGGVETGGVSGAGAMGGAGGCDLPASVCQDAMTLVYYTEPRCENLQCVYTTNTLDCMGSCSNGACQGGFTAPAPP